MQMSDAFSRTKKLLGADAMGRLLRAKVAVFGIGGVGSYAAEALARSGIGSLALFDSDVVCETNLNRQIIATQDTLGQTKVSVMKQRVLSINPDCNVQAYDCFYSVENADAYDLSQYHYIIDAIDTVSSKLVLIMRAAKADVPIISSMGAGNKLDPTRFEVADIYATSVCPLAKVMRHELRQRGIERLKVVYSREAPLKPIEDLESINAKRRSVPGSVAFVPSVAGMILAGVCIKDIAEYGRKQPF